MAEMVIGARVEGSLLDQGDYVPDSVTDAEFAEIMAMSVEHRSQMGPEDDPGCVEYWDRLAEVDEVLAREGSPGWAAEELSWGLTCAARGLGQASVEEGALVRIFDAGVVEGLEAVGRIRTQLDGVGFALAVEAANRGLHTQVGLSLVDWLRVRCPWLSRHEAAQLGEVVKAAGQHWGVPLVEALRTGATGLHRVARVARTMARLAASLDVDQQEAYAAIAIGAATDPGISDADLGRACQKLLIDLLEEKPKDEAEQTARQQRCVTRRPVGPGLTRFTIDAPDTDAALLDGVLNGALAAPTPGEDGSPDERSAAQRKYDALVMVLNRGLANPGAPPSSARASVMVTVQADPRTGRPVGAAFTATGQVFEADQAGRFACIGDVTPIVLGEHGEPLALGRTVRLATPGQFKALMVRDGGCTFPGCSVPGTWCDAHHLIWWCRGGETDIELLVLLCPRHHSLVHDKDLMAEVHGSLVTWHV